MAPQLNLQDQLALERCPHCSVARPHMGKLWAGKTTTHAGQNSRMWATYRCATCGGVVLAAAVEGAGNRVTELYPNVRTVDDSLPERAREYLRQARETVHAPAGAVVLAASAVDAMLKALGKIDGSLYARIEEAAQGHLITQEMSAWAHDVRLDANDQRHSDEESPLPSTDDAARAIEFAEALAQFLFVLPARVKRGRLKGT